MFHVDSLDQNELGPVQNAHYLRPSLRMYVTVQLTMQPHQLHILLHNRAQNLPLLAVVDTVYSGVHIQWDVLQNPQGKDHNPHYTLHNLMWDMGLGQVQHLRH